MLTRRILLPLILGTVAPIFAAATPAHAQAETGTISADAEELGPADRPRRKATTFEYRESDGGGGGGGRRDRDDERTDHQKVVGHFGVGWFGVSNILIDFDLDGDQGGVIAAPVIGVRYWLSEFLGIDGGIGFGVSGSSAETEAGGMNVETDGPATFGFMLHAGLPLAFATGRHYTFIVVPELNIGFATLTRTINQGGPTPMTMEIENTGVRFDIGGRAGAEVHFGFIDIPELALEASVGLYLTRIQATQTQMDVSQRVGQTSITTTSLNNPWDFFRTSVAARYYF
jgi:hypothetical protein